MKSNFSLCSGLLLAGLLLSGCSATERNTETNEQYTSDGSFTSYRLSLARLELPISLKSDEADFPLPDSDYDSVAYQKYKHEYALQPLGILYQSPDYLAILEYSVGDWGLAPLLTTYSLDGVKIDSLAPYSLSGTDLGYEAFETVTFNPEQEIVVRANIRRSEVKDGEEVPGTEKSSTKTTVYRLSKDGTFTLE